MGSPLALLGLMIVLGLLDSTTFGTLLIPLWLLMHPGQIRFSRILLYLGTVAGLYWLIGVGLQSIADQVTEALRPVIDSHTATYLELGLGVMLVVVGVVVNRSRSRRPVPPDSTSDEVTVDARPSLMSRLRHQATSVDVSSHTRSVGTILGLALGAVLVEMVTMYPYLYGIVALARSGPGLPGNAGYLAVYCVIMVLPALLLAVGRVRAHESIAPLLQMMEQLLTGPKARGGVAITVATLGALMIVHATVVLWWG